MSQWQLYWPNWWKLWPYYNYIDDEYNGIPMRSYWFCFGAFQCNWCRMR